MFESQLSVARSAAERAGAIAVSLFEKARVSLKAVNNLVTDADLKAEQAAHAAITKVFPHDSFIGEETQQNKITGADRLWIVDPIDGTGNYAHGVPHFSVSVAYAERGDVKAGVVYDPLRREMFHAVKGEGAFLNNKRLACSPCASIAEALVVTGFYYDRAVTAQPTIDALSRLFGAQVRDVRRTGSAALDFAWVACGRFDAYYEYNLSVWDFAAGMLLVREAGGKCFDRRGEELRLDSTGVAASAPGLAARFMDIVRWAPAGMPIEQS
jgi:myo-inositol-1(or 4)-monophosphatase